MSRKPGRNDPCPCGSGKKYKQCCQFKPDALVNGTPIPNLLRTALQYHQAGFLPEAEALYHQVLQRSPQHPDALYLLGAIALQGGDFRLAVDLTTKAIEANPANPEAYGNLGLALHEQGQLQTAAEQYRKALSIKPDYTNARYNLHALLLDMENMAPAVECLREVVKQNPNDMDATFTLGALLDYLEDVEASAAHFSIVGRAPKLYRARLDAWHYLRSATEKLPPLTGSNIETFRRCVEATSVEGLVLEFGVRHGNTIRQIAALVGEHQSVHGFDSFEGLPEVWHHEPKGSYTTKGVIPSVPTNVQLHIGWFEDTLPKFLEQQSGPVRFVNVDCDIYSSTKTVLDELAPRIVPGTVIVFDEYIGNEHWREDEFKAFQESVAKYGWSYEYLCFSLFTKQVAVKITAIARVT